MGLVELRLIVIKSGIQSRLIEFSHNVPPRISRGVIKGLLFERVVNRMSVRLFN